MNSSGIGFGNDLLKIPMKISVFVDGANLFYSQLNKLKWFVDLRKLLAYISTRGEIVSATYYIGSEGDDEGRQKNFLDALPEMGYSLVTKPVKIIYDTDDNIPRKKANLDIEIVLDMFNTIEHYDMAVLVSGDGDFERALDLLRARGKQFLVVSTEGSIARELRHVAGMNYIDLQNIRGEVERVKSKSGPH